VDKPATKRVGAPAPAATPIAWNKPDSSTLENAQNGDKPIVIFFPGEAADQNADGYMADPAVKALVDDKAIFVKVAFTSDREKAPNSDSPVPTCKLTGDNPSRDYGVKVYPTFVVADKFGNEYFRVESKKPTAKDLEGFFERVSSKMEDATKKLQKNLDAANKAWTAKDRNNALKAVMRTFKEGIVGLDPVEPTVRLYNELLEDARGEIKRLADANDLKGLKALKGALKGTEAEKDVDEAIAAPSNTSK
jgi:hypothetical protein